MLDNEIAESAREHVYRDDIIGRLVAPMPTSTFIRRFWDRDPIVIRRSEERLAFLHSLLALDDLNAIVSESNLRRPFFEIYAEGVPIIDETTASESSWGNARDVGLANIEQIEAHWKLGRTVLLRAMERYWPSAISLCSNLERQTGHAAQVNAFFTPPNASGVAAHYDRSNIFILQIEGRKHWRVWRNPQPKPVVRPGLAFYDSEAVEREIEHDPLLEFILEPGDVFFQPRGFVHSVDTASDPSLHIALTSNVMTWVDGVRYFAHRAVAKVCSDHNGMRDALSMGNQEAESLLKGLISQIADSATLDNARAVLEDDNRSKRDDGRLSLSEFVRNPGGADAR